MKPPFPHPAAALLGLIVLAGCTTPNPRFPSLLPRASETRDESEPVATPAKLVSDPALDAKLAALARTLGEAATAFPPIAAKAKALVGAAKSGGRGSDAWLAAQSLLADLDVLRAQSLTALSEIDTLAIDRGVAGLPAYPAIETLRTAAEAQVKAQGDEIDMIQVQLPAA